VLPFVQAFLLAWPLVIPSPDDKRCGEADGMGTHSLYFYRSVADNKPFNHSCEAASSMEIQSRERNKTGYIGPLRKQQVNTRSRNGSCVAGVFYSSFIVMQSNVSSTPQYPQSEFGNAERSNHLQGLFCAWSMRRNKEVFGEDAR
jgi:hypothetical protein